MLMGTFQQQTHKRNPVQDEWDSRNYRLEDPYVDGAKVVHSCFFSSHVGQTTL